MGIGGGICSCEVGWKGVGGCCGYGGDDKGG